MANAGRPDMQRPEPYDLSPGGKPGPAQRAAIRASNTSAPQAKAAKPRGRLRPAILSGLGGFVLGAVFWHLVGFWSFVSHVVLKGPTAEPQHANIETGSLRPREPRARDTARPDVAARSETGRLRHLTTLSAQPSAAPASAQPCVKVASNGDGNGSTAIPCAGETTAAQSAAQPAAEPPLKRPDVVAVSAGPAEVPAPAAAGWTVEVEASASDRRDQ